MPEFNQLIHIETSMWDQVQAKNMVRKSQVNQMEQKRQWSNCKEIYKSITCKNNPGKLLFYVLKYSKVL